MEQIAILNENIKIYNCSICAEKFGHVNVLLQHIKIIHKKLKILNSIYDKNFGQKRDLLRHIKIIHEKIKDYKCSICAKQYSFKQHLKRHIQIVH